MKKPFTKKDTKRLFKVCEVIKQKLLGDICCDYELGGRNKESQAASFIFRAGWRGRILFYDGFFEKSLQHQLDTIIHEHVHLMMQPVDQVVNRMEGLIVKKDRSLFDENLHVAREIAVDRASGQLAKLLQPHIDQVL